LCYAILHHPVIRATHNDQELNLLRTICKKLWR